MGRQGPQVGRRGGMSPLTMALLGLLAYRAIKGKGTQSGMSGGIGDLLGGNQGTDPRGAGLGGLLGGLFGGGAGGGMLSGGIGELIKQFQQSKKGDVADSWVGKGANKPIAPHEIDETLDPNVVDTLAKQSGLSRDEVLARLSESLPEVVDKLTPDGRLPTQQEAQRWI